MGFFFFFKRLAHPYEDEDDEDYEDDFDDSPRPMERRERDRERSSRNEPAYGNSAGEVLDMAQKSEVKFCKVFCIRCAYSVACVCESVIQTFGKTVEKEYYDQVKLKAAVPEEFAEKFKEEITDKKKKKIEMEEISNDYIEF